VIQIHQKAALAMSVTSALVATGFLSQCPNLIIPNTAKIEIPMANTIGFPHDYDTSKYIGIYFPTHEL
jgi:hypothetical protein